MPFNMPYVTHMHEIEEEQETFYELDYKTINYPLHEGNRGLVATAIVFGNNRTNYSLSEGDPT